MDLSTPDQHAAWQAIERLLHAARHDTGQTPARRGFSSRLPQRRGKRRPGPGGFVERRSRESQREVSLTEANR